MFHQCFNSVSLVFHQCFTYVSPVFHQCFTSFAPVSHKFLTSVSPLFHGDSSVFQRVSSVFLKSFTSVSQVFLMFHKCFKSVSKLFVCHNMEGLFLPKIIVLARASALHSVWTLFEHSWTTLNNYEQLLNNTWNNHESPLKYTL